MSKLHVVEGPLRGKVFEVTQLASIGRDRNCAVRLEGTHVSRIHAKIERRGDSLLLVDNQSRNGIYVNGRKVADFALQPDDVIEIGEHLLVFSPTGDPARRPRKGPAVLETLAEPFAPADFDDRLAKVLPAALAIVAPEDEKEIAKTLLDALLEAAAPERGFVMIADESGQLQPAARRTPLKEEEFFLSNVIHHHLAKENQSVVATDVRRGEPDAGNQFGILCAPLATKRAGFLGLAYLDGKLPEGKTRPDFKPDALRVAAALCAFAAERIAQIRRVPVRGRLGEKPLAEIVAAFEKDCIVGALHRAKGDVPAAAKLLQLEVPALDEKLRAHALVQNPPPPVEWNSVKV